MTNSELERRVKDIERRCCCADEVKFYDALADFPAEGVVDKIYVDESTDLLYRWDGSAYVLVAGGPVDWGDIGGVLADQTDLQTELDLKADLADPTFTGTVVLPGTTSIGAVSNTEISYLDNVTSAIQTQLDGKIDGTIAATQVAYSTAADTIGGTDNLTWDNTNFTATINSTLATQTPILNIGATSGNLGSFRKFGASVAGNIDGTSIPVQTSLHIYSGTGFTQPIVLSSNPFVHLVGWNPTTNNALRHDAVGLKLGTLADAHTSGTARLHLPAGTATASTAPLKLTAGTNLTAPENGAIEFDGTNMFITIGGVRYTLVKQSAGIMNVPAPVYADDAAAGVGGLVTGDVYQTAGGVAMFKQ